MPDSRSSPQKHPKDPLHGVTLERMLTELVEQFGWEELARMIRINCFAVDPSIKSSLTFLRRTPWARAKVEATYIWYLSRRKSRPAKAQSAKDPSPQDPSPEA